jgi:hypothetical protein
MVRFPVVLEVERQFAPARDVVADSLLLEPGPYGAIVHGGTAPFGVEPLERGGRRDGAIYSFQHQRPADEAGVRWIGLTEAWFVV